MYWKESVLISFQLPIEGVVVFVFSHAARGVASLDEEFVIFGNFKLFKTESCLVSRRGPATQNPLRDRLSLTNGGFVGAIVLFDKDPRSCGVDGHVDQGLAAVDKEIGVDDHNPDHSQLWVRVDLVVNDHMTLGRLFV